MVGKMHLNHLEERAMIWISLHGLIP